MYVCVFLVFLMHLYNNCTCMTHNCLNGGCIELVILLNRMKMTIKTIFGHYRVVAMVEKFYDIL